MLTYHSDVTVLGHRKPPWFRISTRNSAANPFDDRWRDMFTINDITTAAINVLGAIDALEAALDCHNLDADVLMAKDHERELLTPGVRDTQFILGMHPQPLPESSIVALTPDGKLPRDLSHEGERGLRHTSRDRSGTNTCRAAVRVIPHGGAFRTVPLYQIVLQT